MAKIEGCAEENEGLLTEIRKLQWNSCAQAQI